MPSAVTDRMQRIAELMESIYRRRLDLQQAYPDPESYDY